jgi:hypothetical protein
MLTLSADISGCAFCSFYRCRFDPEKGGDMEQLEHMELHEFEREDAIAADLVPSQQYSN